MFKRPVDEKEKDQFRPRPSLPPSAYTSPRPVPKVPSIGSSIRSVFSEKKRHKAPPLNSLGSPASASALSLRSADLSDPSRSLPLPRHDTYHMPSMPPRDPPDEEAESPVCPVCLEPLSFSFRLPGEKPHIVPECGHALHEVLPLLPPIFSCTADRSSYPPQACFTAVYGPPPGASKLGVIRKTNLGVCGVCRRPMKVGDGDSGKSNSTPPSFYL